MRLRSRHAVFNHFPFTGEGVSLYANIGGTVRYRNLRLMNGAFLKGTGNDFDIGAASVAKTTRVAFVSSPATEIDYEIPGAWANETVTLDIRRFKDNVENELDNYRTRSITFDGDAEETAEITGQATYLGYDQRDGGIVRLRFLWRPSLNGVQPETFTAIRTAGPTSPANATINAGTGRAVYEIDTPVLSDAAPYTFKIQAANGATTADVLTGLIVAADASGPVAATLISASAW